MIKLLSTIVLILSIVLFPPSVMALVSNNAVPGDLTYPIKRFLESGIYVVLSLNPELKAKFSAVRSERRFSEITVLLERKIGVSSALDELVTQTELASAEIKKVNDPVKKQELINNLSEQIEKYDRGLSEVSRPVPSHPIATTTPQVISTPTPTPQIISTPVPTPNLINVAKSSPTPSLSPSPTPKLSSPVPSSIPSPSSTSTPLSTHEPVVIIHDAEQSQHIDTAREKLEEIKIGLLQSSTNQNINQERYDRKIKIEEEKKLKEEKEKEMRENREKIIKEEKEKKEAEKADPDKIEAEKNKQKKESNKVLQDGF